MVTLREIREKAERYEKRREHSESGEERAYLLDLVARMRAQFHQAEMPHAESCPAQPNVCTCGLTALLRESE